MLPLKVYKGNGITVEVYNVFNRSFNVVWHSDDAINNATAKSFLTEDLAMEYAEQIILNSF